MNHISFNLQWYAHSILIKYNRHTQTYHFLLIFSGSSHQQPRGRNFSITRIACFFSSFIFFSLNSFSTTKSMGTKMTAENCCASTREFRIGNRSLRQSSTRRSAKPVVILGEGRWDSSTTSEIQRGGNRGVWISRQPYARCSGSRKRIAKKER